MTDNILTGIIDRTEQLLPTFHKLFSLANEVATEELASNLYYKTREAFRLLEPFSWDSVSVLHVTKRIFSTPISRYGDCEITDSDIILFRTIGLKDSRSSSYYHPKAYPVREEQLFFNIVREWGLQIGEKTRGPIQEDFLELVKLVKELEDYSNLIIYKKLDVGKTFKSLDEPNEYDNKSKYKVRTNPCIAISFETNRPKWIYIVEKENTDIKRMIEEREGFYLESYDNMYKVEQVREPLLEMYQEALVKMSAIKDHNEPILDKIDELVSAYSFEKAIHRK